MTTVIDVHTHMMPLPYVEALRQHGGEKYSVKETAAGQEAIHLYGAPFTTLFPGMWDYDLRIRAMDTARVDLAIVSLTCPNVYWGSRETSIATAVMVNESMAEQQRARPDRIRWFASLPWQHADAAVAELERALAAGAVGVMVLGNIAGQDLTDPEFASVWRAIDARGLPVLVHPTAPQGLREMHLDEFGLVPPIGFMFDTTLAFSRIILSGFLDRYPKLKLIASHGGGALPYLAGRLDRCHEMIPACAAAVKDKPSSYLQRIWYDTVVYDPAALELCLRTAGSADQVLFGSDYPHNIGDMAGCRARVAALPQATARKIFADSARRIFNL
ncbi:MAG: amidohydrolase [Rubrivivax sp.]|nr:amidohydrolase [Rubrivivax sp.]